MSILTSLMQALFVRLYALNTEVKWGKQKGASALEYIVLAAVIVIAVVVGALLLTGGGEDGNPITNTFQAIADALSDATEE